MTTLHHRFIEPLDLLFLRGNKLFGDPGSFGESLVPPWPSAAAGALRSLMLAAEGIDPAVFARGHYPHATLGTPQAPGSFTLAAFQLARRDAGNRVHTLHPLPADLMVTGAGAERQIQRLQPADAAPGIQHSGPLPRLPVLAQPHRSKPVSGLWLTQQGFARHLAGEAVRPEDLVEASDLWAIDAHVGIGLDPVTGRADDGKLFSMQSVALNSDVGFVVSICGAAPPASGTLRLGGDGRAAALRTVAYEPAVAPLPAIAAARCARLVLTSPGLFAEGWRLPGCDAGGRFELAGVSGRVVCAALPRAEVVSGWDLARWQPKPAQRAVPAGSVYWLDELDTTPEALGKLAAQGLWDEASHNAQRRAEGFNRFTFAVY